MAVISIVIGVLFLLVAAFFMLGWIWPLAAGLVKRRRGESGTVWLVLGSVWGAGSLAVGVLIGLAVFSFIKMSESWDVNEFDAASYEGATATIEASYKGEATLTCSTTDKGMISFQSSDGTFVVPAGKLTPSAYAISKKDAQGGNWHASWSFYSNKMEPFDLVEGGAAQLDRGPPFTVRAKRRALTGGNQKLEIEIFDRAGAEVSLRGKQRPGIQIINEAGEVVWSKTLEYG